jgi:pyruvate/2-oxoglutarate dehydrogenase complex dihydrolipoamide acyltransferase (E2) component
MLEVRVPQLGEGLREVRIVQLLPKAGDVIRRGDPLYVIETDKTTVEMESPRTGRIHRWVVAVDDVVPIGSPIVVLAIDPNDGGDKVLPIAASRLIPPRTRAYAKSKGIEDDKLEEITSVTDKVLPSDIDAYLAKLSAIQPPRTDYVERKVTPEHRTFIYRLRRSASTTIPGTIAIELPWKEFSRTRAQSDGPRPSPFQMFGHAVAKAAQAHPKLRSVMSGDDAVREYDRVNLGLALARQNDGLITAVIRGADQMTLLEFVRASTQQMRKAIRIGDQATDDTQIILTHLGEFDVIDATPTLIAPASSIIFLGAPSGPSDIARVVMTFDHRLMNGMAAAAFLKTLGDNLRRKLLFSPPL